MMRAVIRITLAIASLFAIIVLLLSLTPLGLPSSLKIANFLLPGDLKVKNLGGSILRKIEAERITYRDGELYLRLDNVTLDWKPGRLLFGKTLYIQDLEAQKVTLQTPTSDEPKERKALTLDSFSSDLTIILNRTDLHDITWLNHDLHLERFTSTIVINPRGTRIRDLYVLFNENHFNLTANIGPGFSPNIQVDAKQRLSFDRVQTVSGQTYIEGNFDHLELEQSFTRGIDGELTAVFNDITGELSVNAKGRAEIADINKINQHIVGNLQLDLSLDYDHSDGNGELHLTSTDTLINGLELDANFHAKIEDYVAYWQNNSFTLGNNSLTTSGRYGRDGADFNWNIAANNLGQISQRMAGTLKNTGSMQKNADVKQLQADLTASRFRLRDFSVKSLRASNFRWGSDAKSPISLQLSANEIYYANKGIENIVITASGSQSNTLLDLQVESYDSFLHTNISRTITDSTQLITINKLDLDLVSDELYHLQENPQITITETDISFSQPICTKSSNSQICFSYSKDNQHNTFSLDALNIPNNILSGILHQQIVYFTGKMDLHADAEWQTDQLPSAANFTLEIEPGTARFGRNQQRDWFEFGSSDVVFHLKNDKINTHADINFIKDDFIHWRADVKDWQDLEKAIIDAEFKAKIAELEPLRFFILQTDEFGANLTADMRAKGKILEPDFAGSLNIDNGRFDLAALGVTLSNAKLAMTPDLVSKKLHIEGSVESDGKPLNIDGEAFWATQHPDIKLHFSGENIKITDTDEAVVHASPNIHTHFHEGKLDVTGELHIPSAKLNIRGYRSSISASPDIIILQDVQEPRPPLFILNTDVLLSLGKDVNFKAGGLTTKLEGGITIKKQGENMPRANGQINTKDGSYAAYGQRLIIERGVLTFNNSLLDNPALNIEAVRNVTLVRRASDQYIFSQSDQARQRGGDTLQDGKVGVRITGTAQNPQYILFSMPQLSEEDQLSYLLTGSPAGQIGAAQAAFMLAAIGEASGSLGFSDTDAASLENITSNMGVDVSLAEGTRIDPETGEAISDTNVVVGSALSPKLYVSYSVGLLDPVNLFQVRYQLSRRFALQSVTTSEGDTGGDIIYGIETDGLPWKKRD